MSDHIDGYVRIAERRGWFDRRRTDEEQTEHMRWIRQLAIDNDQQAMCDEVGLLEVRLEKGWHYLHGRDVKPGMESVWLDLLNRYQVVSDVYRFQCVVGDTALEKMRVSRMEPDQAPVLSADQPRLM